MEKLITCSELSRTKTASFTLRNSFGISRTKSRKSFRFLGVMILILGATLQAATNYNSAQRMADKPYTFDDSSIVLVGVQQADGSIDIVYLNPDNVRAAQAGVWGEMVSMFPDAMTIALLGLAGLLYHRRPASASASRRPGLAYGES